MTRRDNKSFKRFKRASDLVESVAKFIKEDFNLLVDDLNSYFSTMSLTRNFNSQIIKDVVIAAGQTKRVSHRLNQEPSYKLIVRQEGGGLILDAKYSKTYVDLTNSGTSEAKITLILFKE